MLTEQAEHHHKEEKRISPEGGQALDSVPHPSVKKCWRSEDARPEASRRALFDEKDAAAPL